jgi:hypothetical protein
MRFALAAYLLVVGGCASTDVCYSDKEIVQLDRVLNRLQRENADLRAVVIEAELMKPQKVAPTAGERR